MKQRVPYLNYLHCLVIYFVMVLHNIHPYQLQGLFLRYIASVYAGRPFRTDECLPCF